MGLDSDRDLIRSLARRLAENGAEAPQLRLEVSRKLAGRSGRGGIVEALRRSPLVGADLDLTREGTAGH